MNGDEVGIDCGGSCADGCITYCSSSDDATNIQPILGVKCAGCHTAGNSGFHDLGDDYSHAHDTVKTSKCADDKTVAECAIELIGSGVMPLNKGCGGPVADDASNSNTCVTDSEYTLLQTWLNQGAVE